jgi:hypothetical protein
MGSSHRLAVVSLVAALSLAACTDDPSPSPSGTAASPSASPATSTPAPTTSSPPPTSAPPPTVPAGYSLDGRTSPTFPNLGGNLGGIGRVRVGHHEGFDRVVWEFPGSGRPSYQVHYVDTPLGDGSGDPVPVRGDAFVEVLITTVGVPAAGTPRPPDAPASALAGTVIAEAMAIYGGFEGYGQAFIGVRGEQRPLRVTTLTNPTRLVVDVHNG